VGEEKDGVVRSLVDDLKAVTKLLEALPLQTTKPQWRRDITKLPPKLKAFYWLEIPLHTIPVSEFVRYMDRRGIRWSKSQM
jgi:hypothetical protein